MRFAMLGFRGKLLNRHRRFGAIVPAKSPSFHLYGGRNRLTRRMRSLILLWCRAVLNGRETCNNCVAFLGWTRHAFP